MASPSLRPVFDPLAAILAWLWPGLGHISRGERKRGVLIMAGILFMFFSGLLVGGLDCVDRRHDPLWFLAQSICGPVAITADLANQRFVQQLPADWRQTAGPRRISELDWQPVRGSDPPRGDPELRQRYADGDPVLLRSLRRIGLGRVNEMGTLFIALAGLMNLVVILDALYARAPIGDEA